MSVVAFNADEYERKKELLKRTICKDSTDDEFDLFMHICKRTGLDAIAKQIYPVFREERQKNGSYIKKMTIQTGIDGLRMIAERTGNYAPGKEPTYTFDANGKLESATSYIKKRTSDGTWHEVSSTAYYDEFVQVQKNKETQKYEPTKFWFKMPRQMLAKCAESHALRKAFPAEMSGVYTHEEMGQANNDYIDISPLEHKETVTHQPIDSKEESTITDEQWAELDFLSLQLGDKEYESKLAEFIGVKSLYDINNERNYGRVIRAMERRLKSKEEGNGSSNVA